jgi:DNA-binding GntR family transcriptional regulator
MSNSDLLITRQTTTLRALVEEKLRTAILTGHFAPGQRLVERELSETFGVGRTSVREALRQLEAESLITNVPHKGPVVSTISLDEAQQLYAVRAMLEGFAGEEFAKNASKADVDSLAAAVDTIKQAAKSGNKDELLTAKTKFYAVIMDNCGNIFVKQMLTLLHNRINLLRATSMMQKGRLTHSLVEIGEILSAVKAKDGARAAKACRNHVENAAKSALAFLAGNQKKPD